MLQLTKISRKPKKMTKTDTRNYKVKFKRLKTTSNRILRFFEKITVSILFSFYL